MEEIDYTSPEAFAEVMHMPPEVAQLMAAMIQDAVVTSEAHNVEFSEINRKLDYIISKLDA